MSKHTPGPWKSHLVDDTTIIDSTGRFIASVCGGDDDLGEADYNNTDEWPILEANARLIATAPEMLEALKAHDAYMLDAGFSGPDDPALHPKAAANWHHCRAAIAKAEGRT